MKTPKDQARICYRCGSPDHLANVCKFKKYKCNWCGKVGHLSKVCKSKSTKGEQESHATNHVEASEVEDDPLGMFAVHDCITDAVTVPIIIEGKEVNMEEEHLKVLEAVLQRLSKYGVQLKAEKCSFMQNQVEFLGYLTDKEGVHPNPEKVKGIMGAPIPTCISELKSFLGMLQYYGKFLPNLSTLLQPLNNLLREGVSWLWGPDCQKAFDDAKQQLLSAKVLTHYDVKLPLVLACDASSYGIGAVISHIMENGEERPIAFASRTLSSSEKNYGQIDKEALAIIYGYEIKHQGTDAHANVDALSRLLVDHVAACQGSELYHFNYAINDLPITCRDIACATQGDKLLSTVVQFVQNGWPDQSCLPEELLPFFYRRNELSREQDCLLWGMRVVIPDEYKSAMLSSLHEDHSGICRMKALVRSYLWWPKLDTAIEETERNCSACQEVKKGAVPAPLIPWKWPTRVWQRLHIDFAEYEGINYLLIVDAHSKWPEVYVTQSTTAAKTIELLSGLFASYGSLKRLCPIIAPSLPLMNLKSSYSQIVLFRPGYHHIIQPPMVELRGPLAYQIKVGDRMCHVHVDHLLSAGNSHSDSNTGGSPTVEVSFPVSTTVLPTMIPTGDTSTPCECPPIEPRELPASQPTVSTTPGRADRPKRTIRPPERSNL
ncbi:Transposon Tf2-11 polyprotein [Stylophora pistillata]|uniref:Transposon Tf2-11 polyprotein n=1 Tax=Stylophora pistillata TaxID=50429 RepID=A0A2B4RQW6_STYPI|nr:Transposon Tf2-11 polyprotein [Stylophora pistillata]